MNPEPPSEKKIYFKLIFIAAFGILALTFSLIGSWTQSINWYLSPSIARGPHPSFWTIGMLFTTVGIYASVIGLTVTFFLLAYCAFKKIRGLIAHLSCLGFIISFCAFLLPFIIHARMGNSTARFYPIQLRNLGHVIKQYKEGQVRQLPQTTNWCDSLIQFDPNLSPNAFINNRNNKVSEGMSEYAFNANLSGLKLSDIANNTVLLFETPLAKNPTGGPELMSTNNHPTKGCFVLFADMRVEFVRAEDFNNLRWKP
ncbi:MAG: hypothetical protein ABSH16_06935 [Sedimentisphaerales bacterium]